MQEIRFRPHKSSLKESLALECIVKDGNDIKELFKNQTLAWQLFDFSTFRCEYYGNDNRDGGYKDTYVIKAKYMFGGTYMEVVVGFTNQEIKF